MFSVIGVRLAPLLLRFFVSLAVAVARIAKLRQTFFRQPLTFEDLVTRTAALGYSTSAPQYLSRFYLTMLDLRLATRRIVDLVLDSSLTLRSTAQEACCSPQDGGCSSAYMV
ncbi:hypothetical protein NEOLEDRAFT_831024 [Neolentinus lepideus HHB14362 ss-1]|uniref:Uncharacterized protein n=1 Tax=Neolentinus lepideus HHB14362 ss-1 TaxID=1314782 RepID=A0A165P9H2_9AGAM|nr:hypothetical protein NEOLEDRAFT_831024 [Neolentinus lepideus HHB14362 ss-1]